MEVIEDIWRIPSRKATISIPPEAGGKVTLSVKLVSGNANPS
jgi:hypothetical protein